MKKLHHPNVVRLFEVIDDPSSEKIYLVMEYCEKGALMRGTMKQEPLDLEVARNSFRDVLRGLRYLHFQVGRGPTSTVTKWERRRLGQRVSGFQWICCKGWWLDDRCWYLPNEMIASVCFAATFFTKFPAHINSHLCCCAINVEGFSIPSFAMGHSSLNFNVACDSSRHQTREYFGIFEGRGRKVVRSRCSCGHFDEWSSAYGGRDKAGGVQAHEILLLMHLQAPSVFLKLNLL